MPGIFIFVSDLLDGGVHQVMVKRGYNGVGDSDELYK